MSIEKFSKQDILDDIYFIDFLNSRPLEPGSIKSYIVRLKDYCNFTRMSPTELIEEAKKEQIDRVWPSDRKIRRRLNTYTRDMEQRLEPSTVKKAVSLLKGFYHEFNIETFSIKTRKPISSDYEDLPTMDEIKQAVRNAKTRDKALILLHLSSGLSANEVLNLKYADFLKAIDTPGDTHINKLRDYISDTTIPSWRLRRGKTKGEKFTTFSSPESTYAIVDYLEERGYECEWLFTPQKYCKRIKDNTYISIFSRINDKHGFGLIEKETQNRFTSHQLRRVFATNLEKAKVDQTKINYMLGHQDKEINKAYFKKDPESIKEDYIAGLDSITVLSKIEHVKFKDAEVQKVLSELKSLKQRDELQRHVIQKKEKEIGELTERITAVEKKLTPEEAATGIIEIFKDSKKNK